MLPAWAKGALMLAVAFAAGAAAGVGYERHRAPHAHDPARVDPQHLMRHFHDQLALDSAQATAIGAILARHQGAVDSTWRAMRPQVHAALHGALREIAAVLRPDQLAKYQRMMEERHGGVPR